MTIDLSLKRMLAHGLTGLSDFKGLMGYRQSPLSSSSRRRTEGGLSCVQTEGRGGEGGGVYTQTKGGSVRRVTPANSSALRLPKPASPAGKTPKPS